MIKWYKNLSIHHNQAHKSSRNARTFSALGRLTLSLSRHCLQRGSIFSGTPSSEGLSPPPTLKIIEKVETSDGQIGLSENSSMRTQPRE